MQKTVDHTQNNDISEHKLPQESRFQFQQIINEIKKYDWKQHLAHTSKSPYLNYYELSKIHLEDIQEMYLKVFQRYQKTSKERNYWLQNQLRIFLWLVVVSPSVFKISYEKYGALQLEKLTAPFFHINKNLSQYQFKVLFISQNNHVWDQAQDKLLSQIIHNNLFKKSTWGFIAKQLFISSEKKFLRNAQACRERWHNYLDQKKRRGHWTDQQDYLIIKSVNKFGKRWAIVSKNLGSSRSEHNVKFRYRSILKRQSRKKNIRAAQQIQICLEIQKKILDRMLKQSSKNLLINTETGCQNNADIKDKQEQQKLVVQNIFQHNNIKYKSEVFVPFTLQKPSTTYSNDNLDEEDIECGISQFLIHSMSQKSEGPYQYPLFVENIMQLLESEQKDKL